jgi:hypothetical protein
MAEEKSSQEAFTGTLKGLYGKRWRERGAEVLGVHPVTIWRWSTGRAVLPPAVTLAVRSLKKGRVDRGQRSRVA